METSEKVEISLSKQDIPAVFFGQALDDRMMDQEFVLRFVAVCYYGIDKYEGIPDNYLNGAMEYLNSSEFEEESVIEMV